jgi:hypothetical protein
VRLAANIIAGHLLLSLLRPDQDSESGFTDRFESGSPKKDIKQKNNRRTEEQQTDRERKKGRRKGR